MERYAHYAVAPDPRYERVLAVDGKLPCFESESWRLVDALEGLAQWIGEPGRAHAERSSGTGARTWRKTVSMSPPPVSF